MAKILEEMPKKAGGIGRQAIYPYDEWLDGQIRQLESGNDYNAKPQSVIASLRQTAENRGLKLRSRFVRNETNEVTGIVVQAFTPPEEVPAESNGHKEVSKIPKSSRRPRKPVTV